MRPAESHLNRRPRRWATTCLLLAFALAPATVWGGSLVLDWHSLLVDTRTVAQDTSRARELFGDSPLFFPATIRVVQVVDTDNSRLVAGKPAVVRLYLKTAKGGTPPNEWPARNVTAKLYMDGVEVGSVSHKGVYPDGCFSAWDTIDFWSSNQKKFPDAFLRNRKKANILAEGTDTINFDLTGGQTAVPGPHRFSAKVCIEDPATGVPEAENDAPVDEQTVTFGERRRWLTLVLFRVAEDGVMAPSVPAFTSFLESVYPLRSVLVIDAESPIEVSSWWGPPDWVHNSMVDSVKRAIYQVLVSAGGSVDQDVVNAAKLRGDRVVAVAMVPHGGKLLRMPGGNQADALTTGGIVLVGTGAAPAEAPKSTAHEIGHLKPFELGDEYLEGFASPSPKNPPGPNISGVMVDLSMGAYNPEYAQGPGAGVQANRPVLHLGSRTMTPRTVVGFMGNALPAWATDREYEVLYDALVRRTTSGSKGRALAAREDLPVGPVAIVQGAASQGSCRVTDVTAWTSAVDLAREATGDHYLAVLDAGGNELDRDLITVIDGWESQVRWEAGESLPFTAVVAWPANATTVILCTLDGTELARLSRSATPPVLTADTSLDGNLLTFSWSVEDDDGDTVSCRLEYSPDGVVPFSPLASGIPGTEFTLDLNTLPGGNGLRFRLLASDGINTDTADFGPYTAPDHAPIVDVWRVDASTVAARLGEPFAFRAAAYDREEGDLPVNGLAWFVDGVAAGSGGELSYAFTGAGYHEVRVTGQDGTGNGGQASLVIVVTDPAHSPAADAGEGVSAWVGAAVSLDGSGSLDPDGDPVSYQWRQTAGPPVTLADAASATPSFAMPAMTSGTACAFQLVVSDGISASPPATVSVTSLGLPPAVAGTVTNESGTAGAIIVQAFTNAGLAGEPAVVTTAVAGRRYALADLESGSYYLRAFADTNSSGTLDADESRGAYGGNVPVAVSVPPGGVALDIRLQASLLDLTAGLTAYYPFSGGPWDASGHDHQGVVNGATLTSGPGQRAGPAYRFDGEDDDIVIPYATDLALGSDDFTVVAFVLFPAGALADGARHALLSQMTDAGNGWDLSVSAAGARFSAVSDGLITLDLTAPFSFAPDTWYSLALTRSGNMWTFFRNGTAAATHTDDSPVPGLTGPFCIGVRMNPGGAISYLRGSLDDVRLYRRALSAGEVRALHRNLADPGLFSVTFGLGAHGTHSGGGELTQAVEYGQAAEAPTVAGSPGWTFSGWDADFASVTADLDVQALYSRTQGVLEVTIQPAAARAAGAQWQVDGGAWQGSGGVSGVLSVGAHAVTCRGLSGWTLPPSRTVTVAAGVTAAVTMTYTRPAHTVTFDLGVHATRTGGGESAQSVEDGEAATAPTLAVQAGWAFTGWSANFAPVTADLVVMAHYRFTALPAPSGLTAVAASSSRIDLTWTDNASAETGFEIERRTGAGGGWSPLATPPANADTWQDSGLGAATIYTYRVRASNALGDSDWSSVAAATTQDVPPAAPANLTAIAASSSRIDLTWEDHAGNEAGFRLERRTDAHWEQIATLPADSTSYQDTGLSATTPYTYRIQATNGVGGSAWSNESEDSTAAPGPPEFDGSSAPLTHAFLPLQTGDRLELAGDGRLAGYGRRWLAIGVETIDGVACLRTRITGHGNHTDPDQDPEWYDLWLAQDTAGAVWVLQMYSAEEDDTTTFGAANASLWLPASATAAIQAFERLGAVAALDATDETLARLPTGLGPYIHCLHISIGYGDEDMSGEFFALGVGLVREDWSSDQDESEGWVLRSLTHTVTFDLGEHAARSGGGELTQKIEHGTAAAAPTLTVEDGWEFAGWSAAFTAVTSGLAVAARYAATPPAAPSELTATTVSASQINLSWTDNGNNETGFRVERKTRTDSPWVQVATPSANTASWPNPGLSAVTTYTYRVCSARVGSDSPWSNEATATTTTMAHSVSFVLDGKGTRTGGGELTQVVVHGEAAAGPTVEVAMGWTFLAWDADFAVVIEPLTVTALYSRLQHAVTFQPGARGSLAGGTPAVTVMVNDGDPAPAAPAVSPAAGWTFTDWSPALPATITALAETTAQYAVAGPTLPTGKFSTQVDAAAVAAGRGWWDLTGPYATTVKGNSLALNLIHDPSGRLSGTATYTVAKDTTVSMLIKGSVKGTRGSITMKGTLKGANVTKLVSVSLTLNLTVDTANRQLVGRLIGTIRENGAPTPVNDDLTLAIPGDMDGIWTLSFDLDQSSRSVTGTAVLTLSNDVKHTFVVKGKTGANNTAVLTLSGSPSDPASKALSIRTTITPLEGGWASLESLLGRGYGQTITW